MTTYRLFDSLSTVKRNILGGLVGSMGGVIGAYLLLLFVAGPQRAFIVFPVSAVSGALLVLAFWHFT